MVRGEALAAVTTAMPPASYTVQLPTFHGSLAELASALRTGRVLPAEVPLLQLTREVLAWVQSMTAGPEHFAGAHPDLLPTLAGVIALKARLLLPRPDPEPDHPDAPEELLDEVVQGVEALAELDALVQFLAQRRHEREGLIPSKPVPLDLPRRQRKPNPQGSLARLVKAAQQAVRQVEVPLLARERLTLADALRALRAFGQRLKHFSFGSITVQDWGERTTYFAALLEGIKEGTFDAQQDEVYGEIQVNSAEG